jgi:hypothetical protein
MLSFPFLNFTTQNIHKLAGVADPCKSDLVISMKEWALRSIGRFTIRKEPITPDIIRNIVAIYGKARADLTHLRIACMCSRANNIVSLAVV